ncbi:MAG: 2-dehydropantoate 2-reductase [Promethearchaeota archaeon]|nr:MAG: 2-dehydropantoate 2-reductase [Candidatus Lokiarchaeota archaeon]
MSDSLKLSKSSRLVFVGAGAIGGVSAGLIKKQGYDVDIITKYKDLATLITSEGIQVMTPRGNFTVIIPAYATVDGLTGKFDLIFMAVKATDLPEAIKSIKPFMHDKSAIVTMENGICEDLVASLVGTDRTIGCITGWGATMHAPGNVEMTSTGEFIIGNLDNSTDDRLIQVQEILSVVNPCYISENLYGSLYSKLIINSCITSLGAVCGLYLGEMLAKYHVREIFIRIIKESIAVANAMGLKVEVYGGKLDYYDMIKSDSWFAKRKRHLLIRLIGFKYRKLKSSSLQSLERNKPTEIDFFNGYIAQQGKKYHISTPINDLVVSQIKEIEAGTRPISPDNFEEYSI